MASRVLSSQAAEDAIKAIRAILDGPLTEQIDALARQGQTLSQPDVWDGALARQFRDLWPDTHSTLIKAKQAVEDLRGSAEKINLDIVGAGGGR